MSIVLSEEVTSASRCHHCCWFVVKKKKRAVVLYPQRHSLFIEAPLSRVVVG